LCHTDTALAQPPHNPAQIGLHKILTQNELTALTVGCRIAIHGGELAKYFQACPLLQQAGRRKVGRRDSVLAGADVCKSFSSQTFSFVGCRRGVFL
jgi:hypothetical protein